jgi:hypothetical protein
MMMKRKGGGTANGRNLPPKGGREREELDDEDDREREELAADEDGHRERDETRMGRRGWIRRSKKEQARKS